MKNSLPCVFKIFDYFQTNCTGNVQDLNVTAAIPMCLTF